jgi:hypothetical protein
VAVLVTWVSTRSIVPEFKKNKRFQVVLTRTEIHVSFFTHTHLDSPGPATGPSHQYLGQERALVRDTLEDALHGGSGVLCVYSVAVVLVRWWW